MLIYEIPCGICETTVDVKAETITSTDQAAVFVIEPRIICAECKSVCMPSLVEKENVGESKKS